MALNKCILQGRLTADPEAKTIGESTQVLNFSIAVDRNFTNKDGEREVDFIDIVAWRSTADFISKYFHKGDQIIVEGSIQVRPWTTQDGEKRRSTEVIADNAYFCGSKKSSGGDGEDLPF